MDAPQKFNELFAELENEVVELDKKKTALDGAIMTLQARETYLKGSVADLNKQAKEAQKGQIEAEQTRQEELDALDDTIFQVKEHIKGLENDKKIAKAELDSLKVSCEKQLKELDEQIIAKKDQSELDKQIEDKHSLINNLEAQISETKEALNSLVEDIEAKTVEHDNALKELATQANEFDKEYQLAVSRLEDKTEELDNIEEKLKDAQSQLTEAERKDREFKDYEKKAIAALETRESALLQGEKQLDIQIVTSRRRHGVLDKV